ncbi:MAG: hypothetical protein ABI439_06405 [Rhodospirillales bacterium]
MSKIWRAASVALLALWAAAPPALAQIAEPAKPIQPVQPVQPVQPGQPSKPVDAVDAVAAWRRLDVSRHAVKDQLELCDDDAGRFGKVGQALKPSDGAEVTEWTDWGVLLRSTGLELRSCLRAARQQVGLLRADSKALRDIMPAVKDAKRMSLSAKQLGEVTKASDDAEREIADADQRVAGMVEAADKIAAEAQRVLRQTGVSKVEPLPPFKSLL